MAEDKQYTLEELKTVEIYALKDPKTKEIRYIGKANDSIKRLVSHLRDAKRRNYPVYNWINKLLDQGLKPEVEVIEYSNTANWKEAEIRLINEYKSKGYKLLNVAIGGDEPYCSTETRANNGRNNANAIHSDEKKKRLWYLKQQLGIYFKKEGNTEHAIMLRQKLALGGVYFK